jgi:hypothetical protein
MTAPSTLKAFEKLAFLFRVYVKLVKLFKILRLMSYRMPISLLTVFAEKKCSAVSPLPEDFYSLLILAGIHLHMTGRMTHSCAKFYTAMLLRAVVHDRTARRAPVCGEF